MVPPPWTALGSPLDSAADNRGEERAPAALRATGLLERLEIQDLGDAHGLLDDRRRDESTGVLAFAQVRDACIAVRDRVVEIDEQGNRPLVLGGDCSLVIGALAGSRRRHPRVGLAYVDGHCDFWDGRTSPTGELADMDLAVVTGDGPPGLVDLAEPPIVRPGDVVVLGHRRNSPESVEEAKRADPRIQLVEGSAIRFGDAATLGKAVGERLERQCGAVWVHFDVDVLDETVMPAVSYPQPGGIDWHDAEALLRALCATPALVGLSIADFVPALDPDGVQLGRLAGVLERVLKG